MSSQRTVTINGKVISHVFKGREYSFEMESYITSALVVGDIPMYIIVGCSDGEIVSIEIPSEEKKVVAHNVLGAVDQIIPFPKTHEYLTMAIDDEGAVMVYDHLYCKTVLYSPPLPSQVSSADYLFPLCVLMLNYTDGRTTVWSLDTGSLLTTLNYYSSQQRVKATTIYQRKQNTM